MFKYETKVALGALSIDTGARPSDLVSWTEQEDWMNRLIFDMEVMRSYHVAEKKAMDKAMKRR